jgi:hypothetical protein
VSGARAGDRAWTVALDAACAALAAVAGLASPQSPAQPAVLEHGADFRGVWTNDPPADTLAYQNDTWSAMLPALTDWGRARFDSAKPSRGPRGVSVTETDDPVYACFPPGTPRVYLHPFPMEIVQTPGRVLMIFEYDHLIRQIYTDGRAHRNDLAPSWMGDSIGRWEGDMLVVETVNFNDKTWLDRTGVQHSEDLRVVERIRALDPDHLEIDITMEDPIALAGPWHGKRRLRRTDWTIEEFSCMDNQNFLDYEREILEFDAPPAP